MKNVIIIDGADFSSVAINSSSTPDTPTTPTSREYVTSGLIFHLDGKEQGGVSNHWIDKIGNIDFTLQGVTDITNGVDFVSGSRADASQELNCAYNTHTIEVCFTPHSTFGDELRVLFLPNAENKLCAAYNATSGLWLNNTTKGSGIEQPSMSFSGITPQIISAANTLFLRNGIEIPTSSVKGGAYPSTMTLNVGCNHAERYADAKIHSIRIYNRLLSASEMLNNAKVDNEKFNLGLSI